MPACGTAGSTHKPPGRAAWGHTATQSPHGVPKGGPVCRLLARMEAGETLRRSVASVLEAEKHV